MCNDNKTHSRDVIPFVHFDVLSIFRFAVKVKQFKIHFSLITDSSQSDPILDLSQISHSYGVPCQLYVSLGQI